MMKTEIHRWESGSDFHLCTDAAFLAGPDDPELVATPNLSFFISGRTALAALIRFGMKQHGWTQVYFPSYYCHDVIDYIRQIGIEANSYPFNPFIDKEDAPLQVPDQSGCAVVRVNYFGAFPASSHSFAKAMVIDDVTHDILGYQSSVADYCFGSLRKELPVPAGGFCSVRSGMLKPEAVHWPEGASVAAMKLSAMYLKSRYLAGYAGKEVYRELFAVGEEQLAHCPPDAGMPLLARAVLSSLNLHAIADARKSNLHRAIQLLHADTIRSKGAQILAKGLGLTLLCSHQEQRDLLKNALISHNIYPAVLWPGQNSPRDRDTEARILFVHLDYRYVAQDVETVVHAINDFFAA